MSNPDFRLAIDDPEHFIGRSALLDEIRQDPYKARIFLGGSRAGKTSLLNAIEWICLEKDCDLFNRAFPVLIDLQLEQPSSLDNLRYVMISKLTRAVEEWRRIPSSSIRESYRAYRRQLIEGTVAIKFPGFEASLKVDNPDRERRLLKDDFKRLFIEKLSELREKQFNGICFLLDGAEFITRQQSWAGDACSYFRALKDSDKELKPFLGITLSGYRELKEYQQKIGSRLLNISDIRWLETLKDTETLELISKRKKAEDIPLGEKGILTIKELAGGHPHLIQQILSFVLNCYKREVLPNRKELIDTLLEHHDNDFSAWWNEAHEVGGCGDNEHAVYHALVAERLGTVATLTQHTSLKSRQVKHALDVLVGTGIIQYLDKGNYRIGSKLFEEWIIRQRN